LAKERALLEAVQKFVCKVCCMNLNTDYDSMLGDLNIPTYIATKEVTIKG